MGGSLGLCDGETLGETVGNGVGIALGASVGQTVKSHTCQGSLEMTGQPALVNVSSRPPSLARPFSAASLK